MKPIKFKGSNKNLLKPDNMSEEECSTLSVFNDGVKSISCWELDEEDLMNIREHKKIWLGVLGGVSQPPVFLTTEKPNYIENSFLSGD